MNLSNDSPTSFPTHNVARPSSGTTGKVLTKRIRPSDRACVPVNYPTSEAHAIRSLAQSISLKGGTRPSLSLLSRRAVQVYIEAFPQIAERETAELNRMVTPVPKPAKTTGKPARGNHE